MPNKNIGPISVSDGQITNHDISEPDADININSSQIRWRGNTPTTSEPLEYANTSTTFERFLTTVPETINLNCPSSPDGTTYSKTVVYGIDTLGEANVELRDPSDGSTLASTTWRQDNYSSISVSNDKFDGSDIDLTVTSTDQKEDDSALYGLQVRTFGTESHTTVTNNGTLKSNSNNSSVSISSDNTTKTVSATFPSLPSNTVFSRHKITISAEVTNNEADLISYESDINGDGTIDTVRKDIIVINNEFSDPNKISDSYFIPNYSGGNTISCDFTTSDYAIYGSDFKCNLTVETQYIEKTADPSVTGDVSGSLNGSLNDGEWSSWQPLNGLDPNRVEDFTHSIGGSGLADFEFEYTWGYSIPDPANGTVGFADQDAGVWRECAVADTSDSALDYNHVTVYNPETGNWGALDVVDLGNSDAMDGWELYDPDVGWVAPREYDSSSI